jgi:hypothetical protein
MVFQIPLPVMFGLLEDVESFRSDYTNCLYLPGMRERTGGPLKFCIPLQQRISLRPIAGLNSSWKVQSPLKAPTLGPR